MPRNKKQNQRGGQNGHQGGGSHAKLTADHIEVLESLSKKSAKRSEKKELRKVARHAAKLLKRGDLDDDSSTSDSSLDSSSDEGGSSKSKRKMKRKWRKKHEHETKELQQQLTEKQQKVDELELLRSKTTAALTPSKDAEEGEGQKNESLKFTLAEWQGLQQEASSEVKPVVPIKKGLFHDLFAEDAASEGSVSSASSIISELDKNLAIADKRQKLALGVSVSGPYEKRARAIANACASKHFAEDEFLPQLQSLVSKYDLSTTAKRCHTVLQALIRAVISRKIDLELEELGLEEEDLDGKT